jgi:glycosyltransferase involved in cell wall biosynthesis
VRMHRDRRGGRVFMPDLTIATSGHDVADARLHREVEALTRQQLTVELLGLGDPSDAPAVTALRTWRRSGPAGRLSLALTLPWRARGRVLMTLDPDLVPAAWLCTRLRRRPLVVDVHEDYQAVLADRSWARSGVGLAARAVVMLANTLAARADLTILADGHVPPKDSRRPLVLQNMPDRVGTASRDALDPRPRALYVGDVRRSRGLWTMLAALEQAPGWSLDVVGPVESADAALLSGWQEHSPAADRVQFHGRRPPRDAWALASGAWAGLVLLDDTPAFRAAVPSKLYEYLAAGIPVIATPLPRVEKVITESGAGVIVSDAAEAAGVLRAWSEDPILVSTLQREARAWARQNVPGAAPYDEFATRVRALAERR